MFLEAWRASLRLNPDPSSEQRLDARYSSLQLYSVTRAQFIRTDTTIGQQGFSDGEVLVLIPEVAPEAHESVFTPLPRPCGCHTMG